ncbi:MAG TPA: helix-turn-helix domain-containing protein [Pyrinomonadaceae bacterium]|jgi:DNA-binding NtrC family response regulator|nr:helix-turn-helix domain-containing protein [Pyrinomonadaceae bacterium]
MSSSFHNINTLREAAMTLLREVESLASQQEPPTTQRLGLQAEMQRYESELIRDALQRTRGNQRRAAKLLGVKVTTLNCKIKRLGLLQDAGSADYQDLNQEVQDIACPS